MQGRVLSAQWRCNPTLSLVVEIRGEQRFADLKVTTLRETAAFCAATFGHSVNDTSVERVCDRYGYLFRQSFEAPLLKGYSW